MRGEIINIKTYHCLLILQLVKRCIALKVSLQERVFIRVIFLELVLPIHDENWLDKSRVLIPLTKIIREISIHLHGRRLLVAYIWRFLSHILPHVSKVI
jgi:hypothetical protein